MATVCLYTILEMLHYIFKNHKVHNLTLITLMYIVAVLEKLSQPEQRCSNQPRDRPQPRCSGGAKKNVKARRRPQGLIVRYLFHIFLLPSFISTGSRCRLSSELSLRLCALHALLSSRVVEFLLSPRPFSAATVLMLSAHTPLLSSVISHT